MAVITVEKTIGTGKTFSTIQLWEDGAPGSLTTAEKSAAGTFAVASFTQGEALTFVGSGATGKFLHTDSTGVGTGTYIIYGITAGNPAASDVVTGDSSGATCTLSSGTPTDVGIIWKGLINNETFSGTSTMLTVAGSTTSTTAYKHLTTDTGASFRDNASVQTNELRANASNGALVTQSGNTDTIAASENNFHMSGLQIENTNATGTFARTFRNSGGTGFVSAFCILEGIPASGIEVYRAISDVIHDCLMVQRKSSGGVVFGQANGGTPTLYNCTLVSPADLTDSAAGILTAATGSVALQNCGIFGFTALHSGTVTPTYTTCHSDLTGTGIVQVTYANQFENVNDATRDYRLKTGADMIGNGSNSTTDTTNAPIDIAKTNRPSGTAYDTGCWEFVAAAGAALTSKLMLLGVS